MNFVLINAIVRLEDLPYIFSAAEREMKKIAVVYSSKSGHTKQYADWLKEDNGEIDVIDLPSFSLSKMMAYKLVIFACGVYGDKLSVMDFIKKNITSMSAQKIMIMAVSWYTNDSEEAAQKLMDENYPEQFKGTVPLYVINSGIDKAKLSAADKIKLKAAQMSINKKAGRSSDDINALAIINGYSDQTSRDNLKSIKKGISEFFDPPKKAAPSVSETSKAQPAAAAKPVNTAAPAAAPPPKPMAASEMKNEADALNSLENAFKALKTPKQPAAAESKPEAKPEINPTAEVKSEAKPAPKADPMKAAVASSVKDAIAALSSGNLSTNYAPAPAFELDESAAESEAVADSIMLANQAISAAVPVPKTAAEEPKTAAEVPKPAPKPAAETPKPAAEVSKPAPKTAAETPKPAAKVPKPVTEEPRPEQPAKSAAAVQLEQLVQAAVPNPVRTAPVPESVLEQPAPQPEPSPQPAPRKNSYMELFAKRRRRTTEETTTETFTSEEQTAAAPAERPFASEVQPAPKPIGRPSAAISQPAPKPIERPSASKISAKSGDTIIDFDFIMDEEPASAAKPLEPIQKETVLTNDIDMDVYDFISEDSKPSVSSRAMNAVRDLAKAKAEAEKEKLKSAEQNRSTSEQQVNENDFLEKMKRDIETLAEESEQELDNKQTPASETEEDSEELDGFTFSNDIDYDLEAEFAMPVEMPAEIKAKESKTNFDLKKLQEEINSSIEMNKAAKEKMEQRYGKKQKEEVHNPFAVQFDEDEGKGKKKKKNAETPAPKRLADPIDPDIFFSKPGKKDDFNSESMPEIKFRNIK